MKTKRVFCLGCLVLAMCLILVGCSSDAPLPEGMVEETVIATGKEVVDELLAGEYEQILERFREDIRSQEGKEITVEVLEELVAEYLDPDEVGEFKEISGSSAKGGGDQETEPHGVAVFHCEYEEVKAAFGVAFDTKMNLIGLSIARE